MQTELPNDLAGSPPQLAMKFRCVLTKCKVVDKAKEEGHTEAFPATQISFFQAVYMYINSLM